MALRNEVESWDHITQLTRRARHHEDAGQLMVSSTFVIDGAEVSLFSTLTSFGSPRNITLDDLSIELFFPADDHTDTVLRDLDP